MTDTVLAVIDNVIRLKKDTVSGGLYNDLREALTRENPAYYQAKRMRERNAMKYRFMKMPPATVTSIDEDNKTILIPRGFRAELTNLVSSNGQTIKFFDSTIDFERDPLIQLNPDVTLKQYQKRGLGSLILNREGILVAPCGGGKTVTGIGIIATLKQPTLVLVHTHDLLDQWRRELAEKALLPGPVGQWGASVRVRSQVTVATIQTLIKMNTRDLKELLDHFGCVILDEAHHCPADTFLGIINLCSAKYRFGLTATPKRKDGLEFLMTDTIGPLLAEIEDSELQAEGRSQTCVVRTVNTSFYTRYTADEWAYLMAELTQDSDRNRLIVQQVLRTWNDGHFPLVLSDRVDHCRVIANSLRANGMNAQLLLGEVPKQQRAQIIQMSKNGLVDAIVATKVADEGLDIPNLSCVHLTTPTANEAKTQQRVGRIRRPIEGKVSLIVDYVDQRVSACIRMAKSRMSMYRRWGFNNE